MASKPTYPRQLSTARLLLRAPGESDRAFWVRLHRDPSLHRYAPAGFAPSDAAASAGFDGVLQHWQNHGFGYQVVEPLRPADHTVEPIGVGGLAHGETGELALYHCFRSPVRGQGYAREAARGWVAAGVEHLDGVVTATTKEHNLGAVRIALAAGLGRAGARLASEESPGHAGAGAAPEDPPEHSSSLLLRAPKIEVVREQGFTQATRRDILDLWTRVTRSGGAVGFLPTDSRSEHAAALQGHEAQMRSGRASAVIVRDPDAPGDPAVAALGWWVRSPGSLLAHRRTAYRVMTDPDKRGRNLGHLLMAAMHRAAREEGTEIATLGVRSGMGLEGFYESCGYREVGRVVGGIRVAAGDDRDEIMMARRLT